MSIYFVHFYILPILCFLAPPSTVSSALSSLQDVVLPLSSSHSPFEKTPNWFRTLSTPQKYNFTRTQYRYSHSYSLLVPALALATRTRTLNAPLALARAHINTRNERVEHSLVKDKLLASTRALVFKFHVICTVWIPCAQMRWVHGCRQYSARLVLVHQRNFAAII